MTQTSSSRRAFLRSSSLAAAALALRGPHTLAQSATQADGNIQIFPSEPIGTIAPDFLAMLIISSIERSPTTTAHAVTGASR